MQHLEHNNMQTDIQTWTVVSFLTGLFNLVYNGLSDWGVHEWVAAGGFLGMVTSLLMQLYYNTRRDRRESEQHEWQREHHKAKLGGKPDEL